MKKLFAILLCVSCLAACSKENPDGGQPDGKPEEKPMELPDYNSMTRLAGQEQFWGMGTPADHTIESLKQLRWENSDKYLYEYDGQNRLTKAYSYTGATSLQFRTIPEDYYGYIEYIYNDREVLCKNYNLISQDMIQAGEGKADLNEQNLITVLNYKENSNGPLKSANDGPYRQAELEYDAAFNNTGARITDSFQEAKAEVKYTWTENNITKMEMTLNGMSITEDIQYGELPNNLNIDLIKNGICTSDIMGLALIDEGKMNLLNLWGRRCEKLPTKATVSYTIDGKTIQEETLFLYETEGQKIKSIYIIEKANGEIDYGRYDLIYAE